MVLVPVKSLAEGKSRLADVLSPAERRALNDMLLRRTLLVASAFAGPGACAVVSPCEEALALARAHGAHALPQTGTGLNEGTDEALACLRARGAGDVVIVACDLPLLRDADLREMARLGQTGGAFVIGADRHGQGTNLLFMPAGARIRCCYGEHSLMKHAREAMRAGHEATTYRSVTAGFDLDTPSDWQAWGALSRAESGIADEEATPPGAFLSPRAPHEVRGLMVHSSFTNFASSRAFASSFSEKARKACGVPGVGSV